VLHPKIWLHITTDLPQIIVPKKIYSNKNFFFDPIAYKTTTFCTTKYFSQRSIVPNSIYVIRYSIFIIFFFYSKLVSNYFTCNSKRKSLQESQNNFLLAFELLNIKFLRRWIFTRTIHRNGYQQILPINIIG